MMGFEQGALRFWKRLGSKLGAVGQVSLVLDVLELGDESDLDGSRVLVRLGSAIRASDLWLEREEKKRERTGCITLV